MGEFIKTNKHYGIKVGISQFGVDRYLDTGDKETKYPEVYLVVNLETGLVEGEETTLPQALGMAEQMDRILRFEYWKTSAEERYPSIDAELEVVEDNEDSEEAVH